jgi:hypothetical protein
MDLSREEKIKLVGDILDIYSTKYSVVPMRKHAQALSNEKNLSTVVPKLKSLGENLPFPENLS